jgi:hypothetical protein
MAIAASIDDQVDSGTYLDAQDALVTVDRASGKAQDALAERLQITETVPADDVNVSPDGLVSHKEPLDREPEETTNGRPKLKKMYELVKACRSDAELDLLAKGEERKRVLSAIEVRRVELASEVSGPARPDQPEDEESWDTFTPSKEDPEDIPNEVDAALARAREAARRASLDPGT